LLCSRQDQEKKALAEKVVNLEKTHMQDDKKCEVLQMEIDNLKSTMASMEEEFLLKSQALSMVHNMEAADEKKAGVKQDEQRTKRRHNTYTDKQQKGGWFRVRGRWRKLETNHLG
jgi:hypothetical protein